MVAETAGNTVMSGDFGMVATVGTHGILTQKIIIIFAIHINLSKKSCKPTDFLKFTRSKKDK